MQMREEDFDQDEYDKFMDQLYKVPPELKGHDIVSEIDVDMTELKDESDKDKS